MKELSIEEKAKAYDEVHEKIAIRFGSNVADEIFSQFEMSEDEKIIHWIRKELESKYVVDNIVNNEMADKALAWLEKQGEQKKVFKSDEMTTLEDKLSSLVVDAVHIYCKENELDTPHCVGLILGDRLAKEWSKEILESAKKELEEIEQKPAWSEEDEAALGDALWCCNQAVSIAKDENDMGNCWYAKHWLKSLKDRVQPQPKQEWSKEDETMIALLHNIISHHYSMDIIKKEEQLKLEDWLKYLKERVQPKQEWSEEDEKYLNIVYSAILSAGVQGIYDYHKVTNNDVRKWLDKFLRPQKQWKPTKAMLEALKWAKCEFHPDCPETMEQLKYLYNELKQLYYDRT